MNFSTSSSAAAMRSSCLQLPLSKFLYLNALEHCLNHGGWNEDGLQNFFDKHWSNTWRIALNFAKALASVAIHLPTQVFDVLFSKASGSEFFFSISLSFSVSLGLDARLRVGALSTLSFSVSLGLDARLRLGALSTLSFSVSLGLDARLRLGAFSSAASSSFSMSFVSLSFSVSLGLDARLRLGAFSSAASSSFSMSFVSLSFSVSLGLDAHLRFGAFSTAASFSFVSLSFSVFLGLDARVPLGAFSPVWSCLLAPLVLLALAGVLLSASGFSASLPSSVSMFFSRCSRRVTIGAYRHEESGDPM